VLCLAASRDTNSIYVSWWVLVLIQWSHVIIKWLWFVIEAMLEVIEIILFLWKLAALAGFRSVDKKASFLFWLVALLSSVYGVVHSAAWMLTKRSRIDISFIIRLIQPLTPVILIELVWVWWVHSSYQLV